jgi:hypothetical protein
MAASVRPRVLAISLDEAPFAINSMRRRPGADFYARHQRPWDCVRPASVGGPLKTAVACFEMEAERNRRYGCPRRITLQDGICCPGIREEIAMKTVSLFVAIVASLSIGPASIAPANAESKCSTTTWPMVSTVPCTKPKATSYAECQSMVKKNGATASDGWWWCSNQGFKS